MEENEVMKSLFDECLAYMKYGQNIHPTHVKDMLRKAFEAGLKDLPTIDYEPEFRTDKLK